MTILLILLLLMMSGALPLPLVLLAFAGAFLGFALFVPVQSSVFESF